MPGYSYWNGEYYFYQTEIIDIIKAIEIERQAKRDNNVTIDTSFAHDLVKVIGLKPTVDT
tara:strand:+ start:493 stop:672 length:180 start_codon:yes stop_codon:yes gene_type:complete